METHAALHPKMLNNVVTLSIVTTAVLILSVFIPVKENKALSPGTIRINILTNL